MYRIIGDSMERLNYKRLIELISDDITIKYDLLNRKLPDNEYYLNKEKADTELQLKIMALEMIVELPDLRGNYD